MHRRRSAPSSAPARRIYSRRALLRLGAAAAGAGLFAACGGEDGAPEPEPDTELPRELRIRPREQAPGDSAHGVLRVGTLGDEVPTEADRLTALLTYSRLVAVDARNATVYGDLATDIELPEPLLARFSLHPEARFHPDESGLARPVTASVVAADFERRAAEDDYLFTRVVDRVEAPDERSLLLHLRGPFSLLFEFLAAAGASVRGADASPGTGTPLGSGPFVPVESAPGGQLLARHPAYHTAGYPLLEGLTIRRFETRREWGDAFARGEVQTWEQGGDAEPMTIDAEGQHFSRPTHRMVGLGLSMLPTRGGAPVHHLTAFQDQRVRRAISRSMDRPALLALREGEVSGPVGPAHRADALPPAELSEHELYGRNVEDARALLAAAGHDALAFRIQVMDEPPLVAQAQRLAEQLNEAGIVPQVRRERPAQWRQAFAAGDFETVLFEIGGLSTPDVGLRLHTSTGVDGTFSPWGYSNPVYDAAVRHALSAIDPAERARRSREAQRLLLDDAPAMLPIAAPLEHAAVTAAARGYAFDAYDFNEGWLSAQWRLSDAEARVPSELTSS